jgi:hypothetical protein
MAYPLIGLTGRKRSGKDSFAARLVAEHGYTRLAFADALREAALALDPIVVGFHEIRLSGVLARDGGWEAAKELPEVRRTLQNYGVAIREIDPEFWVRVVANRAAEIAGPVVVTDVRFPNEADWIDAAEGFLVRIERPGLPDDDTHVSEHALDDRWPDFRIVNDGSLAELAERADNVHRTVRPRY